MIKSYIPFMKLLFYLDYILFLEFMTSGYYYDVIVYF